MVDLPPRKRQKTAPERNPFIDDEAAVDYDESEGEIEDEDEFIQHELTAENLDADTGLYARVDAFLRTQATEGDIHYEEEQQAGNDSQESVAFDAFLRTEATEEDIRYEEEQQAGNDSQESVAFEFTDQDGIWELPCQIGREMEALQALLDTEGNQTVPMVKSATFREDHPGRIFIELDPRRTFLEQKFEAKQVASRASLPMLTPTSVSAIHFIPCPEAMTLLQMDQTPWRAGMWARIRGPKRLYKGDIGFIYSRDNKVTGRASKWVAVVPRINLHTSEKTTRRRPPAQLLDVRALLNYHDIEVQYGEDFTFRNETFNYAGYLLFPFEDLDLYPPNPFPPVPLLEEFERFLCLPILLGESKWAEHRLRVSQQRTAANDRVKILDGQYSGLVGLVLNVRNQVVEVYLSEKDDVVEVGITNIQTELQHGDYVRVVHGEHEGKEGFVTRVDGEWVDVSNPNESTEIHTYFVDVELYTPPTVLAARRGSFEVGDEVRTTSCPLERGVVTAVHDSWLEVTTDQSQEIQVFYREAEHTTNPKTNRVLDALNKSQIDVYSLWRGRYCLVISGPWKGYRGLVKTTHPDGRMGVQLDTRLGQMTEFRFDEILVQDDKLAMPLPPPVSVFSDEQAAVVPEKRPLAIVFPDVDRTEPARWRPRYKAPPTNEPHTPPAIPLDHQCRSLPVPHWLLETVFVPQKIKLIDITGEWKYLQYQMPVEGSSTSVHVRDGTVSKQVPVENLRHIIPEKKNDLVVPLTGEFKGKAMKVKDFGKDECTLLVHGAKPIQKKDYQYPTCPTNSLALIFPPKK